MSTSTQHSALNARDDLLAIADAWPVLEVRLAQQGQGDRSGVKTRPGSKPPLSTDIIDVMAELAAWTTFLARVLMDEVTIETRVLGPVRARPFIDPWRPRSITTPDLLREIARFRVGHFTAHPDEMLRIAFQDEAQENRRKAESAAYPHGRRKIPLHVMCEMHDTSPEGERIACLGWYHATIDPEVTVGIPDMVCDKDGTHRITPAEWQSSIRRTMDPSAAAAFAARLKGDAA
jgi:hypothetical protein